MKPETKSILLKYDEKGSYEYHSDFDYNNLEKRAKQVNEKLNSLGIKTKFEGAVYNQDASFSVAINLDSFGQSKDDYVVLPVILVILHL
jgi:hypothetical protein